MFKLVQVPVKDQINEFGIVSFIYWKCCVIFSLVLVMIKKGVKIMVLEMNIRKNEKVSSEKNVMCVGRESNPDRLLGRQPC